jgi:hypothetical protein
MTTIPENRRFMYFVSWLVALSVIAAVLLGCSPYAGTIVPNTPTAAPSMTPTAEMIANDSNTPTPRPACTVTAYTLNMRRAGRMTAAVIQILENGEELTILSNMYGDWLKVQTPQRVTGWV